MNSNLRVITYNCQSFNSKKVILESLLNSCDLFCLQETFINDENSFNFEKILFLHMFQHGEITNFLGVAVVED